MYGYQIKPQGLPKAVWACDTTVTDYQWKNRNHDRMLEISLSKAPERTVNIRNKEWKLPSDTYILSCVPGDIPVSSYSPAGVPVTITSVAFSFPELAVTAGEITEQTALDHTFFLLPAFQQELSSEELLHLHTLLHKCIKYYAENTSAGQAMCISVLFEILATIDTKTRQSFLPRPDSMSHYYISKANAIIEKHFSEKLTQTEIAKELGISTSYFSYLYKASTGVTFSDHLLQVRMNHAQELLMDPNLPTSRVAQMTGFGEESYFRKKFRQYFDMNIREYRCLKNGVTLYHTKPERRTIPHG